MEKIKKNENRELLKKYLNNYNKEQLKYFIHYLKNYYLNPYDIYYLSAAFNCLALDIDDTLPFIDLDDAYDTLARKNPYYYLDYLTSETVVDTLLDFIAEDDTNQFLYVAKALSIVKYENPPLLSGGVS